MRGSRKVDSIVDMDVLFYRLLRRVDRSLVYVLASLTLKFQTISTKNVLSLIKVTTISNDILTSRES